MSIISLSGYKSLCHHLLSLGETSGFFGKTVKSGSHAASMDWVEQGQVDTAAIDSVVLDMEFAQNPERQDVFRVVECIGPCPMPPVAAVSGLDNSLYQQLTEALVAMHAERQGQTLLQANGIKRFAAVTDDDYDPIRFIVQNLQEAGLTTLH